MSKFKLGDVVTVAYHKGKTYTFKVGDRVRITECAWDTASKKERASYLHDYIGHEGEIADVGITDSSVGCSWDYKVKFGYNESVFYFDDQLEPAEKYILECKGTEIHRLSSSRDQRPFTSKRMRDLFISDHPTASFTSHAEVGQEVWLVTWNAELEEKLAIAKDCDHEFPHGEDYCVKCRITGVELVEAGQ